MHLSRRCVYPSLCIPRWLYIDSHNTFLFRIKLVFFLILTEPILIKFESGPKIRLARVATLMHSKRITSFSSRPSKSAKSCCLMKRSVIAKTSELQLTSKAPLTEEEKITQREKLGLPTGILGGLGSLGRRDIVGLSAEPGWFSWVFSDEGWLSTGSSLPGATVWRSFNSTGPAAPASLARPPSGLSTL